jgi:hypothetical protein
MAHAMSPTQRLAAMLSRQLVVATTTKPNLGHLALPSGGHTLPFKKGHGLPILKWYGMSSCDL